jgi:uncharacterized membrane protein YcaP (DUF421 family)
MQVQNESEIIDAALKKTGSTRRWLLDRLKKEHDVTLTDSMLSNRFQGRYKWKQNRVESY